MPLISKYQMRTTIEYDLQLCGLIDNTNITHITSCASTPVTPASCIVTIIISHLHVFSGDFWSSTTKRIIGSWFVSTGDVPFQKQASTKGVHR
jgi:hypothetical protein